MEIATVLKDFLYLLALLNPASKVVLLATLEPRLTRRKLFDISLKSTIAAFIILLTLSFTGPFIFKYVFHVKLYSLQIAGGVVLFFIGFTAIREGIFFRHQYKDALSEDFSIVPLASPFIAGPGMITAGISLASEHGVIGTTIALTMALGANFLIMLSSSWIGNALKYLHIIGPLIRITGLIVSAVAIQMFLDGFSDWIQELIISVPEIY